MSLLNFIINQALIFKNPFQNPVFNWLYIPVACIVLFPIIRFYVLQWYAYNIVSISIHPQNHEKDGRSYYIMVANHSSEPLINAYVHVKIDSKEFSYSRKYYSHQNLQYDSENFPHIGKLPWVILDSDDSTYIDMSPGNVKSVQFLRYNYPENLLEVESEVVVRNYANNEKVRVMLNPDYNLNFRIYLNCENLLQIIMDVHWDGNDKALYFGRYKNKKNKK